MAANPAREPLQAILGRAKPASGAAEARDFRRPRRLGQTRLQEISRDLEKALPALERKLQETIGLQAELALARLGEVDAGTLFNAAEEPLCILRFSVQGNPAWLAWEPAAAVSAVEEILGAKGSPGARRALSPIEVKVASTLLGEVARGIGGALQLAASDFALVQSAEELGSWRDGGERAEPHRLEVELTVRRGEQASLLRLHLPGIDPGPSAKIEPLPAELPAHLEQVEVELSARLPGCAISLDQLVDLEEGDVIPLEARLGDPALLQVEGLSLATARLGSHRGRLAVRIEQLSVRAEEAG